MATISPKIRVFVSSTFLDMQKERDVLNQEVFPIVKGVCDNLGVAFNVIDLRWGITEEDQAQGNVIDLCLDEIQHCKPYFIGLIGNRYGWIPDQLDPDLEEKYQFIKENQDKSVTELEMILGALAEENRERCFFYYKDPALFDASTTDHKEDKIEALKRKIESLDIRHSDYASFEQFKERVLHDLLEAIEKDYPKGGNLMEIKQQAYLSLLPNGNPGRMFAACQALDLLSYAESNNLALAVIAPDRLGKTTLFNQFVNSRPEGDKIIINFEADIIMHYFPAYYLYKLIRKGLEDAGYLVEDDEALPFPENLNNYESALQASLATLKRNLYQTEYKRPMYILVNDANLFYNNDRSKTFFRTFLFDDQPLPDNLHVIITTNSTQQRENVPMAFAEMHPTDDDPKRYFTEYLSQFAKKIDKDLLDKANQQLKYTDYKLIADYLIYYCNFSSYRQTAEKLLSKANFMEILRYVYDDFVANMPMKCASVFTEILLRLHIFKPGFSESALFDSYDKKTALEEVAEYQVYVDLTEIEKAAIMRPLRYFTNVDSGTIFISDPYIRLFIGKDLKYLFDILSRTYEERSAALANSMFEKYNSVVKFGRAIGREEYLALIRSKEVKDQSMKYAVLDPLCAYLNKIIMDYASRDLNDDEDAFNPELLDEKEIKMLVYVQEAAQLYMFNTRADLYTKLLENASLMLFICCKSHSLFRRLIADYIALNLHIQKTQFSHVDENMLTFTVNYALRCIVNADKEKYGELAIANAIDNAIMVLEEHGRLDGELLRLAEDEDKGAILMQDFAINACSGEACADLYDIDYDTYDDDPEALADTLSDLLDRFDATPNVSDKILYSYYIIKTFMALSDADSMPNELYEPVQQVFVKTQELQRYCFFPEVTAMLDIYFGRLVPKRLLWRMQLGLEVMKSQGFNESLEEYEEAYEYFKNKA